MSRVTDATAIICGITIETDEAGRVFCPPIELYAQYDADADFRRYFDEELEGLYLLDDELGHCAAGDHLVPTAELVAVETLAATDLSPAEHDEICKSCARHEGPEYDENDWRI